MVGGYWWEDGEEELLLDVTGRMGCMVLSVEENGNGAGVFCSEGHQLCGIEEEGLVIKLLS